MFYKRHIFFCTNKKDDGKGCGYLAGEDGQACAKKYLQAADKWGEGKYRASKSGCLGRCNDGPVCVVYPDGVWYTYVDKADIKEIVDTHVIKGEVVSRLKI